MVRVDPGETTTLIDAGAVHPVEMRGRRMNGWVRVSSQQLRSICELAYWVDRGLSYARSPAPKKTLRTALTPTIPPDPARLRRQTWSRRTSPAARLAGRPAKTRCMKDRRQNRGQSRSLIEIERRFWVREPAGVRPHYRSAGRRDQERQPGASDPGRRPRRSHRGLPRTLQIVAMRSPDVVRSHAESRRLARVRLS
jgi:hypothetical protein